jgi:hypothetical protein
MNGRAIPPAFRAGVGDKATFLPRGRSESPVCAAEYVGLMRSGLARLTDAQNPAHSQEGRFDLAYHAGQAWCLAALRRMGYRAHWRYLVFRAVPHTLRLGP